MAELNGRREKLLGSHYSEKIGAVAKIPIPQCVEDANLVEQYFGLFKTRVSNWENRLAEPQSVTEFKEDVEVHVRDVRNHVLGRADRFADLAKDDLPTDVEVLPRHPVFSGTVFS